MVTKAKNVDWDAVNRKILALMKALDMSRYRLAKEMGIAESSVSKNFSGKTNWGIESIVKMSQIFGVSTDSLLKVNEAHDDDLKYMKIIEEKDKKIKELESDKVSLLEAMEKIIKLSQRGTFGGGAETKLLIKKAGLKHEKSKSGD